MKKISTALLLIFISTYFSYASIHRNSIPAPPDGCLVNGKMYTSYVGLSIDYVAFSSTYVENYRYIFRPNIVENCYSNVSLFYGPSPGGSGNVPIGCYLSNYIPSYSATSHNDSYNFVLNCPIDNYIWYFLLPFGTMAFLFIKNRKIA